MKEINDSFQTLKERFHQEVGKQWDKDIPLYIQYVQAMALTTIADSLSEIKAHLQKG
jgi:hypothetical protein